jgi:hypothetical protein
MNDWTPWVLVALVIVALVAWMFYREKRSRELHRRFGPEYDRMVGERGSRGQAEAELDRRAKRVDRLSIRPLAADKRSRYSAMWNEQQARFVDEPETAVNEADRLVEEVMKERGYPVGDFEQRAADVSVDHPQVVENYRAAHGIVERQRRGEASTEELRRAMVYFRDLFRELLEDRPMRMEGAR